VDVCKKWERSFFDWRIPEIRHVALRTAIVLGKRGGVLEPYTNMARWGFGGPQGNGNQYFSWIHEEDLARIIEFVISSEIDGVVNAAAPKPVSNQHFMTAVRKSLSIPIGIPMPEIMIKAGAWIIGTESELLLKSRYVVPDRLLKNGFRFKYSKIEDALESLLS
jgi:uncharacterized protein (TIGR01777 family)